MDAFQALRGVLLGDSAMALGRLGREVEAALVALEHAGADERSDAEYRCADAVWRLFVQREACGLMSHVQVLETYAIPPSVLAKVGARRPAPARSTDDGTRDDSIG